MSVIDIGALVGKGDLVHVAARTATAFGDVFVVFRCGARSYVDTLPTIRRPIVPTCLGCVSQ